MFSIGGIIRQIRVKKLMAAVEESKAVMKKYKNENVFKSKTLNELMSDTYTYTGKKPDTIPVKDSKTGKPIELRVRFSHLLGRGHMRREKYVLSTIDGKIAADKDFYFFRNIDKKLKMDWGSMENYHRSRLIGVGVKLDQIEIERALRNNIEKIPVYSTSDALLFHTKMGFLPTEGRLVEVKCINAAKRYVKKYAHEIKNNISEKYYKPIIIERNGKFYIDLNKTQANANMSQIKENLRKNSGKNVSAGYISLELSGEELEHWKELIKGHEITKNFSSKFPEY